MNSDNHSNDLAAPSQVKPLASLYDKSPDAYEAEISGGILGYFRKRERSAVLRGAEFETGTQLSVLDAGAGNGFLSKYAKSKGHTVHAVDLFPGPLEGLKNIVDKTIQANLEHLDLGRTYDRVVCAGVFEFLDKPEQAFNRLAAHVGPEGKLVFLCPRQGIGGQYYRVEKYFQKLKPRLYRRTWFEEMAKGHGMKLERFEKPLPTNMMLAFSRA